MHRLVARDSRAISALLFSMVLAGCLPTKGAPDSSSAVSVEFGAPAPSPIPQPAPAPAPQQPTGTSPDRPIAAAPASGGYREMRVRTASLGQTPPSPSDGVGAFRNPCGYSHMAFDDPIIYPGQPGAAHLHVFFGNTSANAYTTTASLKAAGESTCAGGIANLSAYWMPAMVDTTTNKALLPVDTLFYYKRGYNLVPANTVQGPPVGLRLVGGNLLTQSGPLDYNSRAHYECNSEYSTRQQHILSCAPGSYLNLFVLFPSCWDGVNLDSPDHRSHVVYVDGGSCPTSHPVALPEIALNVRYQVEAGQDTTKWRLSSDAYNKSTPGGYTMHADIWFAWNEEMQNTWVNNCVRASMDCHAFLLGDGRELY